MEIGNERQMHVVWFDCLLVVTLAKYYKVEAINGSLSLVPAICFIILSILSTYTQLLTVKRLHLYILVGVINISIV